MTRKNIKIYKGGVSVDDRGTVKFINDFDFQNIKRFYQINNFSTETVRAFHGHKKESKYVYVSRGSALICLVKIDNFENPSKKLKIRRFVLSSQNPQALHIPPGHANGTKSLQKQTSIIIYSTSSLKQSEKDDYRYPYDYWGKDIWKVENR